MNTSLGQAAPTIKFATVNVNTLHDNEFEANVTTAEGVNTNGRTQIIEALLRNNGMDIVTVQEGRFKTAQTKVGCHYDIYACGGANGQYGSQVWVAHALRAKTMAAAAVNPRIALRAMSLGTGTGDGMFTLVAISAHAPMKPDLPMNVTSSGTRWRRPPWTCKRGGPMRS